MSHKKWMIIIYLAGDNNLSESMAGSFKDFGKTFGNFPQNPAEVALLIFFDGGLFNTPTFYCDFSQSHHATVKTQNI